MHETEILPFGGVAHAVTLLWNGPWEGYISNGVTIPS